MAVLEEYLPQQLDAAAIEPVVAAVIAELGATGPEGHGCRDEGRDGEAWRGGADGKTVSAIVERLLRGELTDGALVADSRRPHPSSRSRPRHFLEAADATRRWRRSAWTAAPRISAIEVTLHRR